ncbi:MAG: YbfB/YjiJ family MFS transporter, partial [Magnetospirillum sp.]|nr:YbfB/YjiJ family MFS transporter [Magnetospirillum sp.]
ARTIGWLTAVFGIGQIVGPVLAAWLAARGGWSPALLMASGAVLTGVPLLWLGGVWARRNQTAAASSL